LLPALLLGGALAAQQQGGAATNFDVKKHGFNFVNWFTGDILVDVPLIGRVDLGNTTYGLCGGMTYSARDTFVADGTAPDCVSQPNGNGPAEIQPGQPLRSWLYDRQLDSMKAEDAFLVRRLVAWSWRPIKTRFGVTGLHVLSDREFKDKIAKRIDQGKPVPLCLIKADIDDYLPGRSGLVPEGFTKNHQVLAIGYRLCPETSAMKRHWAIDVYDPNYPDEVHTLHYSEDGRAQTRRVRNDGTLVSDPDDPGKNKVGKFRGFFVTPYSPKLPYWVKPDVGRLAALSRVEALQIGERPEDGFDEPGARVDDALAQERAEAGRDGEDQGRYDGGLAREKQGGKGKKSGGGLDGLKTPPITASEGTTTIAIRGKPGSGYTLVDGPADYVRLGRVVVPFPEQTDVKSTLVAILDPDTGKELTHAYGVAAFDLLPGVYSVQVSTKQVAQVVVEAKKDAVLQCGVLRVEVGKGQLVEVLDTDEKTELAHGYGKLEVGLPVGKFFVRVQKRTEAVTIENGKVVEF
jgi:hypothetical protein